MMNYYVATASVAVDVAVDFVVAVAVAVAAAVAVAVDLAVDAAVVDFAVDAAAVVVAVAVVLRPFPFSPADRPASKHFRRRRDRQTAPFHLPASAVDAGPRHPESAQQGR